MKVAIPTGGGDCPGLDAVVRAVVRRGEQHGFEPRRGLLTVTAGIVQS
jgi:6-phosphofructokinase